MESSAKIGSGVKKVYIQMCRQQAKAGNYMAQRYLNRNKGDTMTDVVRKTKELWKRNAGWGECEVCGKLTKNTDALGRYVHSRPEECEESK